MSVVTTPPSPPTRPSSGFNFFSRIRSYRNSRELTDLQPPPVHRTSSHESSPYQSTRSSLFSIPAQEGTGSKSRRLSASPLDDFVVDVCPLEDEFVSASKIGRRKEIGRGATATVKIMMRKGDKREEGGCLYAAKEFRKKSARETEEEYVRKVKSECAIAKSASHPNIVQTVRLCTSNGRLNHVMEYCQQGELFSLVARKYFKAEDRNCIFKQVLRGVDYLHDHGIAHRDIKLENLLMTDEGHIKITDFGVSEVFCGAHPGIASSSGAGGHGMREIRKSAPGICGSKPYISPEVLVRGQEYDPTKLDAWSCGILYMTMLLVGNPWQSASTDEMNYAVFLEGWQAFLERFHDAPIDENTYPQCGPMFNTLASRSQRRCIMKLLHPDPDRRCTVKEALNDRWVKAIDCCSPEAKDAASTEGIDVSKMGCDKIAARMRVQVKHDHLPPPIKRLPRHRFDMGDGTSRYD